ncbi:MAG: hypothetical protein M1828_005911 [Chrysothrix sp. TS-e1954]|nr:MAG: hypothetical protein M1828_005911 [Chrysothrix sp. TS-e1954]
MPNGGYHAETAGFIRRTVCNEEGDDTGAPTSVLDALPPLTSSNDVDLELYAIVAAIIQDYVHPWYQKITPDRDLVEEVVHIIAHCTRALEQRLRKVDLEELALNRLPKILDAHLDSWRLAQQASQAHTSTHNAAQIYHDLRPHPALAPICSDEASPADIEVQKQNDQAYRHLLAQGLLAVLLPTEDVQNQCLFALVSEVLADLILGQFVGGRLCESYFIYDAVHKASEHLQHKLQSRRWILDTPDEPKDRLKKFGLLSYDEATHERRRGLAAFVEAFWTFMQYAFIAFIGLRAFISAMITASTLPHRHYVASRSPLMPRSPNLFHPGHDSKDAEKLASPRDQRPSSDCPALPIMSMHVWPAIGKLAQLGRRMPWLYGAISLIEQVAVTGPGRVGETDSRLDR